MFKTSSSETILKRGEPMRGFGGFGENNPPPKYMDEHCFIIYYDNNTDND